jgi:uncharacterized membrane protein YfcA
MSPLVIAGALILGLVIGGTSGLVGIGGGAFLIPALVYFFGMSQHRAQGTSLGTLILPVSIFAFWNYYKAGQVDFKMSLLLALGFAVGGWFGGAWAQHLSENVLRKGFAVLLVLLAARLAFTR